MNIKPVKVALVGSGHISYTYLNSLANKFSIVEMVGCSDLIPERSKARAELFGIRQMSNEEILFDSEIEIVVNTTNIEAHSEVTRMALEAGKHVYSEKMMACTFEEAKVIVELAKEKNLRFGAAPDTYMGSAYQTARKLIDDGYIGTPLMAQAILIRPDNISNEKNVVNKQRFAAGTTIPYDMGGYYINALINLLGPVNRVSGYAKFFEDRVYTNPVNPMYKMPIEKQDGTSMMMGCLEFVNGCYGNLVVINDGFSPEIQRLEVYGTKGSMVCPDPNFFGGYGRDVYLTRAGSQSPIKVPFTHGFGDTDPSLPTLSGQHEPGYNSNRGIGVADMAWAIRRNRPHRNSAELALHAMEIVTSIEKSSCCNVVYPMTSRPAQPAPLAAGFLGTDAEATLDF
jgi:predicted dehydrogenase